MEDKVLSKVVLSGTIKERVGKMKFCFVPGGAAVLLQASPELVSRQQSFCVSAGVWGSFYNAESSSVCLVKL